MSTIREQIVTLIAAALNTGAPSGIPVFVRTRLDSPGVNQLPAATLYQALESVDSMRDGKEGHYSRGPVVRRSVLIHIEVLTQAGINEQPDKTADPILAWATKAIVALGRCGALAHGPAEEQGTKFEYEQGECSFCRATLAFKVYYSSAVGDAESTT